MSDLINRLMRRGTCNALFPRNFVGNAPAIRCQLQRRHDGAHQHDSHIAKARWTDTGKNGYTIERYQTGEGQ